jgi:hypothetical protein
MSEKAKHLLKLILATDDCTTVLTKQNARAGDELKQLGLVEFFPISTGGAWISATSKGVDYFSR